MKEHILFLSTKNACRSQMLEGMLRQMAPGLYEVWSAGTDPAESMEPLAVETMHEAEIDISMQRPKSVHEVLGQPFELVVLLTKEAEAAFASLPFSGTPDHFYWSFADPLAPDEEQDRTYAFRRVREEMKARLQLWREIDNRNDIPAAWKRPARDESA